MSRKKALGDGRWAMGTRNRSALTIRYPLSAIRFEV